MHKLTFNYILLYSPGLLIIFAALFGIIGNIENKQVFEQGHNAYAIVIAEPTTELSSKHAVVKLSFNNEIFVKDVGPSYEENLGKEKVLVRVSNDETKLFMLNETFDHNIISAVLVILGTIFAYFMLQRSLNKSIRKSLGN